MTATASVNWKHGKYLLPILTIVLVGGVLASVSAQRSASSAPAWFAEPACQTLTPSSHGGPVPKGQNVMILRWMGASNYELAFRDSVILFNAYYERTPPALPLGFTRDAVTKATAIYIGHGHADHMADAPYVAGRTRAPIIGGPPTAEHALKMGVPQSQVVSVTGNGEIQKYNGFTVEAVLARHNARSRELAEQAGATWRTMQKITGLARTPEQQAAQARVGPRGTRDPRVIDQGTIAYLVTFDNGFRLMYLDSSGPITDRERAVMKRIGGRVDIAMVAYQGYYTTGPQVAATLPLVRLFNPDVFMPTHHDDSGGGFPDMAGYPLFMAIRDVMPHTRSISPLHRTPVCFDLQTKDVYIGEPWAWGNPSVRSN